MPARFVLEVPADNGGCIDHGWYESCAFQRLPDGSYLCAGHWGSPTYLRCIGQRGEEIDVVDKDVVRTFRLMPYPSSRYPTLDA
jgi:hypothetical protein